MATPADGAPAAGGGKSGTIVGRDGRAKAYRPIPAAARAAALRAGLAAYDRGDVFQAHEELEPAWMGTADPAERAVLQGLIKLAAAYVHQARGNSAGIERNLVGARARLVEPGTAAAAEHLAGIDLAALVADIDLRLAALVADPPDTTIEPPGHPPARDMNPSMPPIPTVDVVEAERRLRDDPARPLLLDVREPTEFADVRVPGAALLPTSVFMARLGELPADRPLLVICHVGGRSATVTAYLTRAGRTDVTNVAGGMDAWVRAGLPTRSGPIEDGEGAIPASA